MHPTTTPYLDQWLASQSADTRAAIDWLLAIGPKSSNPFIKGIWQQVSQYIAIEESGDVPPYKHPMTDKQRTSLVNTYLTWKRGHGR